MFKKYLNLKDVIDSCLNILLSIILNIFYIPYLFKHFFKGKGRVHILGNGPSLKKDYNRFANLLRNEDSIMCVNMFANSSLYTSLKPQLYVLVDPYFFAEEKDLWACTEEEKKSFNDVIINLASRTNWSLTLFVPCNAINTDAVRHIKSNKYIHIIPLKNIPTVGGNVSINAILYYFNLSNPLFQNVLIASLYISIKAKYKQIYIWGSDHSWLETYTVKSDNKIYIKEAHFYNDKSAYKRLTLDETVRIDTSLLNFVRCFRAYYDLKKYASMKQTQILNCASTSWIDAFERIGTDSNDNY